MKGAKLLLYMTTQLRQIRISLLSFLTKLSSRLRPGTDLFFHLDLIVCLLIQTRDVKITKRFSDKKIPGVFRSRCIKPLLLKKISVRSLICIENVKIEVIFFKINLTHQLSPSLHFWSEEGRPFWKPNRGSFFRSANYYIIFFI